MCGIVAYAGREQAAPILLEGLRRLEYRGYDSAGVAVAAGNRLTVRKSAGRLEQLQQLLDGQPAPGFTGIGHTRWATHGPPAARNAHPQLDCRGQVAVVHNGIIENFASLREELAARGHRFASDTDTEVIAHLIEEYYQGDLASAVRAALGRLRGSWAVAVLHGADPGSIVVARQDSPLVVGIGQGAYYAASDIPALLPYTRDVLVLEDGDLAVLTPGGVQVLDGSGRPAAKPVWHVDWDAAAAEKRGWPHFMIKEIHEQPQAIRETLAGRLEPEQGRILLPEVALDHDFVRGLHKIHIVGMGTARHAGLVGRLLLERFARVSVEVDWAAEYRYRDPLVDEDTLVVAISQSGETADTLAAAREARARGARVLAITNVVGSSLAREADDVLYTRAGPEVSVASTKAYTTQLVVLTLLAGYLGRVRETGDPAAIAALVQELAQLPDAVGAVLSMKDRAQEWAEGLVGHGQAFFIGRGLDAATAMEGALKLKEIAYIHAEAYPAGELKHGPLALVEEGVPVIAVATQRPLLDKMAGNIQEVRARGGRVRTVARVQGAQEIVDPETILLPAAADEVMPVLAAVLLQMVAYYTAVLRGVDVDKPRNLAKSVTVE